MSTFTPNIVFSQIPQFTQLSFLSNVTINSNNGKYYVSDNVIPNSIYTIDKITGQPSLYLQGVTNHLFEPVGVEFDNKNNMFVANFLNSDSNGISVFGPDKTFIGKITDPLFRNLGGLGFHNGILYALNGLPIDDTTSPYYGLYIMFKIIVDVSNGILSSSVSVFCTDTLDVPLFMCFDKHCNCFVTNFHNNTISKINMKTAQASVFIDNSKGLLGPRGIAIDSKSNLYVTNGDFQTKNYFITKINNHGDVIVFSKNNLNSPRGLAIDTENCIENLLVCNFESKLTKITLNSLIFDVGQNNLKNETKFKIIDKTSDKIIKKFTLNIKCCECNNNVYIDFNKIYNKLKCLIKNI